VKTEIDKTVVLRVTFGREPLAFTAREKCRLKVFENGPEENISTCERGSNKRLTLKYMLKKQGRGVGTGIILFRIGSSRGTL
jgi:hypothetical protein